MYSRDILLCIRVIAGVCNYLVGKHHRNLQIILQIIQLFGDYGGACIAYQDIATPAIITAKSLQPWIRMHLSTEYVPGMILQ